MDMRETLTGMCQEALDAKDIRLYYILSTALAECDKMSNRIILDRLRQYHGAIVRYSAGRSD